jgi:hypothetical protein
MEAIVLKSGHVFDPGIPDFGPATKLFKTVARELRDVDIDLEKLDLTKLEDLDAGFFLKAFLQVAGSDAIEACVFECAVKSRINDLKIQRGTFEAEDMRQDYLPVAWEVIKMTLIPFFAGLSLPSSSPKKGDPASPA